MSQRNRFKISLQELESVHVKVADMVEELDPTPPNPDAKSEDERRRDGLLRFGAPSP